MNVTYTMLYAIFWGPTIYFTISSRGSESITPPKLHFFNIIDRVLINLGNNCINGFFLFADFKKAFDPVDVTSLIGKLRLYDDDCSLQLMKSYLYRA